MYIFYFLSYKEKPYQIRHVLLLSPILQMWKLRCKENAKFGQEHTANKWSCLNPLSWCAFPVTRCKFLLMELLLTQSSYQENNTRGFKPGQFVHLGQRQGTGPDDLWSF